MAQDIHVTSKTIADIQRNLREYVIPGLERLKGTVDSTHVPFPGFGTLGLVLVGKYDSVRDDVKGHVDEAIETIGKWIEALETIKKNWRDAEDASKVVYQ
ncbi:hypothetical protein MF672_002050 [Actinomadura sp. ATCC 31491]|uniref:ESX-1 secretion-associated protein n=1 Tax=Actinomadura luzonensis TaxID=2805427 RepID=A0ABT0FJW2_9ACTN|nr:hypothetical protein [Actinomadura luzonensis]MCK2212588.1 hypothetical protein [Actinomadura luzonensis]